MTATTVVEVVTRLYAAAGARIATDVDFEVYADALDDIDDALAKAAAVELVRDLDLAATRPSPGMLRRRALDLRIRQASSRALPTGEVVPDVCARCGGTGWVEHDPPGPDTGCGTVRRCPCQAHDDMRRRNNHPTQCTCSACHRGLTSTRRAG